MLCCLRRSLQLLVLCGSTLLATELLAGDRCPAGRPADVIATDQIGPTRDPLLTAPPSLPSTGTNGKPKFEIPPHLPGANAPPISVPSREKAEPAVREKILRELFPELPALGPELMPCPGPDDKPLTLAALQEMALANNPTIRQAQANVAAACGQARQAGLYPNPNIGYQADQIDAVGTAGQQGGFVEFIIKTAGKLQIARAAKMIDVFNARLALRRAQVDLITQVRTQYFEVVVARESLLVSRAMAQVAEELFRLQVLQVKGGQAAAYEPLQLQVFAVQARGNVVQARNRYLSAWKQLAAVLGKPDLPPTDLYGRADAPVPSYPYDAALARILKSHTELGTAHNNILQARHNLRLAQVTPIPDVTNHIYVQRDNTTHPAFGQVGVQTGIALPIFDRNQGNIQTANAELSRTLLDVQRVQNDLTQRLAAVYERYENNRVLVRYYRQQVLPSQVRVYRAVYERYQHEPEKVAWSDIVIAQQTLAGSLSSYLTALREQWNAVVAVAELLQTDELYLLGAEHCGSVVEPLAELKNTWPKADPEERVEFEITVRRPPGGKP